MYTEFEIMGPQSSKPSLGQRVAASRSQLGLSQTDVAKRAGLAASYLSRIENGKIHPTVPTAQKIAGALRVPLGELLGPTPLQQKDQGCPVSARGICLIDLVDHRRQLRSAEDTEHYSPRQIRVMRRFTKLVREGSPEILNGLDVVIGGLLAQRGNGEPH
jgi:transcriptional regulator with XRE-family HTH domain